VGFFLGTILILVFLVGVLLLVGHFYPGSGADLLDWKPTRSYETEMRRRRGAPELTRDELDQKVAEDQAARLRGRGPFSS